MGFYKPKVCEACKHRIYPIKDDEGVIWQNFFKVDWVSFLFGISIVILLIGFSQIQKQCYSVIENPCTYTHDSYGNDLCKNNSFAVDVDSYFAGNPYEMRKTNIRQDTPRVP